MKVIAKTFKKFTPKGVLVNVASDGDTSRCSLFLSERIDILNPVSFQLFSSMPLMDTKLFLGKYSIDNDVKNVIKRIRGIIISNTRSIKFISKFFNKEHIKILVPYITSNLLDPKDYQNVPSAVKLFKALTNINESQFDQLNKAALDVKHEIQLFIILIKKLLIVFTGLNMSLHEQLSSLACLSFLLFCIQFRNNTSFLTNALYSDIQMTFQNHFWVTSFSKTF